MTKREFKNYANGKLHTIKQLHDAFITLLAEGIADICREQMGKQFKFEEPERFRTNDPYEYDQTACIESVYHTGESVHVRYRNLETGESGETPLYRFNTNAQYVIMNSIAQSTYGTGYRGEWC